MMPSVQGLVFQFHDSNLDASLPHAPRINKGTLILEKDWLEKAEGLALPEVPLRVTARASGN